MSELTRAWVAKSGQCWLAPDGGGSFEYVESEVPPYDALCRSREDAEQIGEDHGEPGWTVVEVQLNMKVSEASDREMWRRGTELADKWMNSPFDVENEVGAFVTSNARPPRIVMIMYRHIRSVDTGQGAAFFRQYVEHFVD